MCLHVSGQFTDIPASPPQSITYVYMSQASQPINMYLYVYCTRREPAPACIRDCSHDMTDGCVHLLNNSWKCHQLAENEVFVPTLCGYTRAHTFIFFKFSNEIMIGKWFSTSLVNKLWIYFLKNLRNRCWFHLIVICILQGCRLETRFVIHLWTGGVRVKDDRHVGRLCLSL
jgi:hypothetical protein